MKKNKQEPIRLNLAIKPEVRSRMDALCSETSAETITELIRRSLAVYDYLWTQKKSGAKLIVQDENGQREIVLL